VPAHAQIEMTFDLLQTLAIAGATLFAGYGIRRLIPRLSTLNIPPAVLGGLIVALLLLAARSSGMAPPAFDTSLQPLLLVGFFTTVGFSASVALLRAGGPQVVLLLAITSVVAILQNLAGIAVAMGFGLPPLFGVLAGSVTLTGGPATGMAFAPLFEQAGVVGAGSIAIATAMAGIVLGGLVGGPIATLLIERNRLHAKNADVSPLPASIEEHSHSPAGDAVQTFVAIKTVVVVLVTMGMGSAVSAAIGSAGITLPGYIGGMLVAAAVRYVDDRTGWIGLSHRSIQMLGAVALSLFLAMALMTLDLTKLAGLAVPLLVILCVQTLLSSALCLWPVFQLMGRDYDAAVMTGGFLGFILGTTANAMAVMRALVENYGDAPRAFLVAPLVGAFFLDFTNALIITFFLNVLG